MTPEQAYRDEVKKLEEAQRRVGSIAKDDPAREAAKAEVESAMQRVRDAKQAVADSTRKKNFAGLTSPFADACKARLDPATVAELEATALAIQDAREQAARERKAAKATATPPSPPPPPKPPEPAKGPLRRQRPAEVEVMVRRPQAGGGAR